MNTIKFEKGNELVVAHRGLSGIETENTNSAFVAAANRSYYGIETDIHVTADGHFVVNHDGNLKRIAGVDISVASATLAELQNVVLYDKDGSKNRIDLRPCTLENYISICKKYEKHCVLELKPEFTDEQTAAFINIIKQLDYLDNVTFISFKYENLLKVRKIVPTQSAQFLFSEITDEVISNLVRDKIDVDVHYRALNEENICAMHGFGIKINCYTVDNPIDAERLAALGVDYITSNILE